MRLLFFVLFLVKSAWALTAGTNVTVVDTTIAASAGAITCSADGYLTTTTSMAGSESAAASTNGSIGEMRCHRFMPVCSMTVTKLLGRTDTGVAGAQCAWCVYSSDGNTLLLNSGVQSCANSNTDRLTTGLSTAITAGTVYWGCGSVSVVTAKLSGIGTGNNTKLFNAGNTWVATATNIAQFNDACTAASTPYACCTGVDTGTCTGCPATLGTMGAVDGGLPHITLAP